VTAIIAPAPGAGEAKVVRRPQIIAPAAGDGQAKGVVQTPGRRPQSSPRGWGRPGELIRSPLIRGLLRSLFTRVVVESRLVLQAGPTVGAEAHTSSHSNKRPMHE
jgi:hypothetical protein